MKLTTITLTILTSVSLFIGTAGKSEANSIVRENGKLAAASFAMVTVAHGEGYINRSNYEEAIGVIRYGHNGCKANQATCREISKGYETMIQEFGRELSPQEISKAFELIGNPEFMAGVNQALGY